MGAEAGRSESVNPETFPAKQSGPAGKKKQKNVGNSSIQYWTPSFSPPSDDKRLRPRDYKTKTWPELTPQAEQYDL